MQTNLSRSVTGSDVTTHQVNIVSQCLPINFYVLMTKNTVLHDNCSSRRYDFIMLMFLCVFYIDDVFPRWRHQPFNMADRFLLTFLQIVDFKCKFLRVDRMLFVDITIKIIRHLCCLGKWIKYVWYVNFGVHGPLRC